MLIDNALGKFTFKGLPLSEIVRKAYDLKSEDQLTGLPNWTRSKRYDIEAKEDEATVNALEKLHGDEREKQLQLMLQSLLADRFKLQAKQETKEIPVYALVVAKGGVKMKPNTTPLPTSMNNGQFPPQSGPQVQVNPGRLIATLCSMSMFANALSEMGGLDRPVIDHTGLTGNYDWTLTWTPDQNAPPFMGAGGSSTSAAATSDSSDVSIFTAIQEQIGLKLDSRKEPAPVVVIEHIEEPSPN
jgi:uncharacterized protein (TIGR03435 family)